jgi:hypothetical protein
MGSGWTWERQQENTLAQAEASARASGLANLCFFAWATNVIK